MALFSSSVMNSLKDVDVFYSFKISKLREIKFVSSDITGSGAWKCSFPRI